MVELIVFDWDGTLFDSMAALIHCGERAAKKVGLPVPSANSIRDGIGLRADEAARRLFPDISDAQLNDFRVAFSQGTSQADQTARLFAGTEMVLKQLRKEKYLLGIATSKQRSNWQADAKRFGVDRLFDASRCGDEAFSKPHPQLLEEVLEQLGVSQEKAVMVGDTEYDMQLANNAGVAAVAVTYGVHSRERLLQNQPAACIDDIRDLPRILKEF